MDRVVVVTGASSGIGLAAAVAFSEAGDHVVATVRRTSHRDALEVAAAAAGAAMEILPLDVTDDASVDELVDDVYGRHGRIDVLVNNAGLGCVGTLEELSLEDFHRSLDVNFLGVVRATKAVLPRMRAAGHGHVVAVTSLGGAFGQPFNDAYCAAKFAVEGLYESLHPVAARFGVRVSIVEPGPVATDFRRHSLAARGSDDAELSRLRERYTKVTDAAFSRAQSSEGAAAVIVAVADDPAAVLRYQTSNFAAKLVERKISDTTGERLAALTGSWLADDPTG